MLNDFVVSISRRPVDVKLRYIGRTTCVVLRYGYAGYIDAGFWCTSLARENGFPVLEVYAPRRGKRTVAWRGRLKVGLWAHSPVTIVRFYPPQPHRGVPEWSKVAVLKTAVRSSTVGSNPTSSAICGYRLTVRLRSPKPSILVQVLVPVP